MPESTRQDRILIVDDDKTFRSVTKRLLEDDGYWVEATVSANEAMALFEKKHFDLLLSDLVMPGIGGLDFLNDVKSHYPAIPVIMITGFASINSAVEAMERGAEDYLTKPCGNDELLIRIRRALEKSRERQELQRLRTELLNQRGEEKLLHEAQRKKFTEEEITQRYARLILEEVGGNKKEACRILGINFHTLQRRLSED
jgi:DNA-binding NtrC family response regulator